MIYFLILGVRACQGEFPKWFQGPLCVYKYDTKTCVWSKAADMPDAVYRHESRPCVLNGRVYVVCRYYNIITLYVLQNSPSTLT